MRSLLSLAALLAISHISATEISGRSSDPCTALGGQKWAAPQDVRACLSSFPVNSTIKAGIIETVNKTLAFHTSVNYEFRAPEPFTQDVHEDLLADLARISQQSYASDLDLHIDLSRTLKRLNDGHCVYLNSCYDTLFITYLPTPLVLLTNADGTQDVHIAPEAFAVASVEFADEIDFWQNSLPGPLKGQLSSLSGAKVLAIDGQDPFVAVNANALVTGSFQGFGTRQNSFFSSYNLGLTGWVYVFGDFAQTSLPLKDSANLTVQRVNTSETETFTIPYRSRIGSRTKNFTDSASLWANNCVAVNGTNGDDLRETSSQSRRSIADPSAKPISRFQQQPPISANDAQKHPINVLLDAIPPSDVVLPPGLQPTGTPLNGSSGVAAFYLLDDGITGVFALGSFAAADFDTFQASLLTGLQALKDKGASRLIVDVTNNGGGFICIAHWLHRIIVGPSATTVPQAGLDTKARDGPLAQLIVKAIVNGADPNAELLYNPTGFSNEDNVFFTSTTDWLQPPVDITVNGRADAFSQRLGQECQPFSQSPPNEALFNASAVAIVSNGRCASSCSLFSVTMQKIEGAKTVVVGGKHDVQQQYCGTVGGQSTDYSTLDTDVKTTGLKNNSLAPPDFQTNSVQGVTWRLAFGVEDTTQPEEWQSRPATLNLPLTAPTVNNPTAIWESVALAVF